MKSKRKELKLQYKGRQITGGVYAIKSTRGRQLLESTTDLLGSKNRFDFAVKTNSCPNAKIRQAWQELGPDAFAFEPLEEITKKDAQTMKEFEADVAALKELWAEKLSLAGALPAKDAP
jgi:hypothetical protein